MFTDGENFFKYITSGACTDRLKIPREHPWNKEREFPDRVNLKDNNGNSWPVKLLLVEDQVCFVDGWLNFIQDNHVEKGNFLVFENTGPNVLSVRCFDSTIKCEIGGSFRDLNSEDEQVEYDAAEDEEVEDKDEDVNAPRGSINCTSRISNDIYGKEIFESGMMPLPTNPYFITRIKPHRQNELHIPVNVVKDFNLELPEKAMIRDAKGNQWDTKLWRWKDGRLLYKDGWASFFRVNLVQADEQFIVEFVKEDGVMVFKPYVIRLQS